MIVNERIRILETNKAKTVETKAEIKYKKFVIDLIGMKVNKFKLGKSDFELMSISYLVLSFEWLKFL
jgi:hypothetical protein